MWELQGVGSSLTSDVKWILGTSCLLASVPLLMTFPRQTVFVFHFFIYKYKYRILAATVPQCLLFPSNSILSFWSLINLGALHVTPWQPAHLFSALWPQVCP